MSVPEAMITNEILRQKVEAFARESGVSLEHAPEEPLEVVRFIKAVLSARRAINHGLRIYCGS